MDLKGSTVDLKQQIMDQKKKQINDLNVSKRKIYLIKTKYKQKVRNLMDSVPKQNGKERSSSNRYYPEFDNNKGRVSDFDDSQSVILNELYTDSNQKSSSGFYPKSYKYDKEVSIRELQFQEKLKEIERIQNMNDSLVNTLNKKRHNRFSDVLVSAPQHEDNIRKSLERSNKSENLSVERIQRSESMAYKLSPIKLVKNRRNRLSEPINFSMNQLIYITEAEDNSNWNELSSKQLEDKVRQSIKEVDTVLKLSNTDNPNYGESMKTPSTKKSSVVDDTPQTPFEKFRSMLKLGINKKPSPVHTNKPNFTPKSKDSPKKKVARTPRIPPLKLDTRLDGEFLPELSNSPNLRYKCSDYDAMMGSAEGQNQKQSTIESSDQNKPSSAKKEDSSQKNSSSPEGDSLVEYEETAEKQKERQSPEIKEKLTFKIKIDERQYEEDVIRSSMDAAKQEYINMKSRAYTANMPLQCISEDINSPYFASSKSNINSFSNAQKTPKAATSSLTNEGKRNSGSGEGEFNETDNRPNKIDGLTQTTFSDNVTESAPVDKLEKKLIKVAQKKNKLISVFETYLNEVDEHKQTLTKTAKKVTKTKPFVLGKSKSRHTSARRRNYKLPAVSKTPKFDILQPILSTRNKASAETKMQFV